MQKNKDNLNLNPLGTKEGARFIDVGVIETMNTWGIDKQVQNEVFNQVEFHAGEYTNLETRAKVIAETPKYINDKGLIFIRAGFNIMSGYPAGECSDVASSLFFELDFMGITDYLDSLSIQVLICSGLEPDHFNQDKMGHVFLAFYKGKAETGKIDPDKCIIIDPAMQKIAKYANSRYIIQKPNVNKEARHADFTKYLMDYDSGYQGIQGKDTFILGLTKSTKYSVAMGYRKADNIIGPIIIVGNGKKELGVMFRNERGEIVQTISELFPEMESEDRSQLGVVFESLEKPNFQSITDSMTMIDTHGHSYYTYIDEQGASINSLFTKKAN